MKRAGRILAHKDAVSKRHVLPFPATAVTLLRRGKEAIGKDQVLSIPETFVRHLPPKFAHAHIADRTGVKARTVASQFTIVQPG